MFKKFTALFCTLVIILSIFAVCGVGAMAASEIEVDATSAMLVEAETGTILFEENADARVYPASTTKIMTVITALKAVEAGRVNLDDIVVVSDNAYFDIGKDASSQNLAAGEEFTLENLLYCALVASANEACNVIGEYISGSPLSFVHERNTYANELGCTGTNFANTHGMPNDNHYTTAKDMYLIFREALSLPDFEKIAGTSSYTVPATNISNSRRLTNTNELINPKSKLRYSNCKGGKTGYTESAGHCLVSYAENDNMRLIAVVMGAGMKTGSSTPTDTLHFSETTKLYEWGFENFSNQTILSSKELVTEIPVSMGKGKDSIVLRPQSDITVIIDSSVPIDKISRDIKIYNQESDKPLMAPISA
ncbi:MAG: D-alanyl-D-alanine carboxypeptidase, partial [Oscillospiraceae bacterium]|nr:D-alanyl-D-alanine carboxypeptidase [Oscillospiraceae bacterium]